MKFVFRSSEILEICFRLDLFSRTSVKYHRGYKHIIGAVKTLLSIYCGFNELDRHAV